jgi:hypothetical protein
MPICLQEAECLVYTGNKQNKLDIKMNYQYKVTEKLIIKLEILAHLIGDVLP